MSKRPVRGVDALNVTVRLFAIYREKAGTAELMLELPEGADVGHLADEMRRRYPSLTQDASALVVAVNQEYVDHDLMLSDGDEVALIPPVSGGSLAR